MGDIAIRMAELPQDFPIIQAIRQTVFQVEQGVSAELEFDGKDDQAQHLIAYLKGQPVGTVRLRLLVPQRVKLERLAVLQSARGQGIGRQLMETSLNFLAENGISEVEIHAQAYIESFYQGLGFEPEGDRFEEAGILHVKMRKKLT